MIEQLVRTGQARFEFRHFLGHSGTEFAAEAMECAADQSGNAFWRFHDEYMTNNAMRASRNQAFTYAEEIGLDVDQFRQCMNNRTHRDRINSDFSTAKRAGVARTPTIFVDERNAGTPLAAITRAVERASP